MAATVRQLALRALSLLGVLLAVLGYVLGTYGGLAAAFLLQQVARVYGG